MNTHCGKIAQLPREVRDELNERLERAEPGPAILEWVNSIPDVQDLIRDCFDGVPITKQNLSEWRNGAHREWCFRERLIDYAKDVPDLAFDLTHGMKGNDLFDGIAAILAARIAAILYECDGELTPRMKEEVRLFKTLSMAVVRLQRTGFRAAKERLELDRLREEGEEAMEKKVQGQMLGQLFGALQHNEVSSACGGGTAGSKIATLFEKVLAKDYENMPVLEPTDTFAKKSKRPKKPAQNDQNPEKSSPVAQSPGTFSPDSETETDPASPSGEDPEEDS